MIFHHSKNCLELCFHFRYLVAELKCPTKEKLSKLVTFLVESIERVRCYCPNATIGSSDGCPPSFSTTITDDMLKIARGHNPALDRYAITSSASTSSSSSPLQKQR